MPGDGRGGMAVQCLPERGEAAAESFTMRLGDVSPRVPSAQSGQGSAGSRSRPDLGPISA
eukprot:CAMPEP_0202771320 /NCGR_PEP_ID=MMETSP1388-20130828/40549_1 /ASSEMBLY_ACC=CAM_ASM_000864 /TAXON_ID=37098 /ORGANISM="Isochrysis sp, Strain CCMP1244" /LENGTH=59 /DNA_ID=CAMNT_0049440221 /DNA_START=86 /DNA_END=262 /DNA_ORIENTATION=+